MTGKASSGDSLALMLKVNESVPYSLEALQKAVTSEVTLMLTTLWMLSVVFFWDVVWRIWQKHARTHARREKSRSGNRKKFPPLEMQLGHILS